LNTIIVLAHPEKSSFNGQMADLAAQTLSKGTAHGCHILDLYRLGFDPLERAEHFAVRQNADHFDAQAEQRHASDNGTLPADVEEHLAAVENADLMILQYPLWWYAPPAILKGWLDRVFVYGRAYTSRRRYDAGVFRGKKAMLSVTTGGPETTFHFNGRNGDIEHLLWPLNFTLYYLGFTVLSPFVSFGVEGGVKYSSSDAVKRRLRDYKQHYRAALDSWMTRAVIPFNGWNDWDEDGRLKPGVTGFSPFMRANS
jgi:NAD(P)H dehydrogenase (quinone)